MAKKSKSKRTKQAPKAVKRGSSASRASNGMQVSGNARAAISSSMPRPFRSLRSLPNDIVEVKGLELIQAISTSQGPQSFAFLLNPGNSQYFKSLASTAFSYEKYRFTNLRLRYWTQAPSSRSGVVSAVIILDPLSTPPEDPQAFMAYANSLTRAISLDGASVPHRINDGKWLYVALDASPGNSTDPTTRYQGLVSWQSQGASSDDAGLLSGYLGLEYTCQFLGHRPMRNTILSLEPKAMDFKGGGTAFDQTCVYDSSPNCVGSYDLQIEGEGETETNNVVPGYNSATTYTDSWASYLGKHLLNYYLPLGVAAVDGKRVEPEKGFVSRPPVSLSRSRIGGPWTCEVGGAITDVVPMWVDVMCTSSDDEKKNGLLSHPVRMSQLKSSESYQLRGNAAGDVTVAITCAKPDGSASESIDSVTTSSGTGALSLRRCYQFSETVKNCRLKLTVVPTGTETRSLSTGGSVAYTEFTGDENLF